MKKKIFTIITAVVIAVTLTPMFSFATGENALLDDEVIIENLEDVEIIKEDYSNEDDVNMTLLVSEDNPTESSNATDYDTGQIKSVVDDEGSVIAKTIDNADKVDDDLIEKIIETSDINIEKIDNDLFCLDIDIQEPVRTITFDDGKNVEEYEEYGIIVENQTDIKTDAIVKNLTTRTSSKEKLSVLSMVRKLLIPEVCAYSTDEENQSYGAIKATLRVVYEKTNADFRKYVRSSTKLGKKYSDAKITKLIVKCHVGASLARSTPKYQHGKMTSVNKTTSKSFNNPKCGAWYKASSPTSLYCYRGGYLCHCNNYTTVYWKRNGKTHSHEFDLFHNDSIL